MENIRIISRNKEIIELSFKILGNIFNISAKNLPKPTTFSQPNSPVLEDADLKNNLIILDLTSIRIVEDYFKNTQDFFYSYDAKNYNIKIKENEADFKDNTANSTSQYDASQYDHRLIEELKNVQTPKLLVINFDIAPILLKNIISYEDVIFINQIKEELFLRVNLIIIKYRVEDLKNLIIVDDLVINNEKYEVSVRGNIIELTFKEYKLLKLLIQNENKVLTRNILLSKIWDYDFFGGTRTVDVHIRRIRAKLPSPYDQMLKTVRNVGYIFSRKI